MKDSLSVNEFSKLSGIERTTLRYWDEIGLFSPARRDPENNYRYYSPYQIISVNFVSVLSDFNIPLKTIATERDERTPESIVSLIERQEKHLDMELRRLQERQAVMHERLELIRHGLRITKESDVPPVSVECLPEKAFIPGLLNTFKEGEKFYGAFMRFCNQAKELRINLNYPIGSYHESFESFSAAPGQPDRYLSLDPTGNLIRSAGEHLVAFSRGYYGELDDMPARMRAYAEEHDLTITGPVFLTYLHDEICTEDPARYLAQACVAVQRGATRRL